MTTDGWKKLLDKAHSSGFPETRIRDLAYALLQSRFADSELCRSIVFPSESNSQEDADAYDRSPLQTFLQSMFTQKKEPTKGAEPKIEAKPKQQGEDITFQQNRAEMLELLREIGRLKESGELAAKDAVKLEADLRVKLNDKFEVQNEENASYIVVQPVCNHICEITRRECWLQTREYAMEHWHLIPDPDYVGEVPPDPAWGD